MTQKARSREERGAGRAGDGVRRTTGNVTLSDVARLAGVSIATASKALNGRDQVRAETRERVLDAAERLSFRPNPLARGLLAGATGTVGLLTGDLEGRFSLPILMGAEDAFGAGELSVFLCDARGDAIRERHHVRALLDRRVDGLIVVGSSTDPRPSLGRDLPVPVVYAYAPSEDPADLSFVPDNVAAGRMAVEHLLACGRTRIAHIAGDAGYAATTDRIAGIAAALAEAGLEPAAPCRTGAWSESWGRAGTAMLLDQGAEPDGLVCGNDQLARGALDSLRDRGLRVPDDVAVVGFDNWQVMTEGCRPMLTSLDMNLEQLGRDAATALAQAIADGGTLAGGVRAQPARLVVRGSSVPLT
ncbi:LacI family DNA-binding transcriptional regulator [Streptomyces sp. WG7]|uniref:LacI family DNA-binding transcriptional regulator n=1 Tax=Streptomyces sp. WG7 TaxID=3417650 RepID=UPI003CF99744